MQLLPFWDHKGQCLHLEGFPESIEDWVRASQHDLDDSRRSLLNAVETVMHSPVSLVKRRSEGMNLTLEAELESGTAIIIRQNYPSKDPKDQAWKSRKFDSEVFVLSYLKENTHIPVPELHAVVRGTDTNFVVMNKVPGVMLVNAFGLSSTAVKEQIVFSYAELVLEMFRLPVPQRIGSIIAGQPDRPLELAALIRYHAERVFDTLAEYLDHLFSQKREIVLTQMTDAYRSQALDTLKKLEAHTRILVQRLTKPSLLRCSLVHDDLQTYNILVEPSDGRITAVIDWEFHSTRPAVLAAHYPAWLLYAGPQDPRFASPNILWEESPEESARLCDLYAEVIRSKDPEYHEALIEGTMLRCVVGWLEEQLNKGDHCDRLRAWMNCAFESESESLNFVH